MSINQLKRYVYVFCKNGKEKETFKIYSTHKLEIKTFKLRINDEQKMKFKEKRKDKNITCK
jgi:hypothetical protein